MAFDKNSIISNKNLIFKLDNMYNKLIIIKISLTLHLLLFGLLSIKAQNNIKQGLTLIAHRGGIVDSLHAENSFISVKESIRRGYKMIEVDIRETADDRAILQHDPNFIRYYNCSSLVSDLTWKEIKKLRNDVNGSRPILFKELAKVVKGKSSLMLDIKNNNFSDSFYKEVENALRKYGLMESTLILGGNQAKEYFPEASHSIAYENLLKAIENGEDVSKKYHLFMLASQLDSEKIKKAFEFDVTVVAAVNEFRYKDEGKDVFVYAKQDVDRLLALGVTHFQIDSIYEHFFYD